MIFDIIMGLITLTLLVTFWGILFFAFDAEVLNGHFKRKIRARFSVDNGT